MTTADRLRSRLDDLQDQGRLHMPPERVDLIAERVAAAAADHPQVAAALAQITQPGDFPPDFTRLGVVMDAAVGPGWST